MCRIRQMLLYCADLISSNLKKIPGLFGRTRGADTHRVKVFSFPVGIDWDTFVNKPSTYTGAESQAQFIGDCERGPET